MSARSIRREDFSDFQKLHFAVFGNAPSTETIGGFVREGEIFIVEAPFRDADGLLGFVHMHYLESCTKDTPGIPIIKRVGVAKHARGTGIGRKLLASVIHAYPGQVQVRLDDRDRDSAGFFLACGFHVYGYGKKATLLRYDLMVDTATLHRLEHILGKTATKSRRGKGSI